MKCPNCGVTMVRTPDKILTSNPPMYELKCPNCGAIKYQYTHVIDPDYTEFKEGVLMEMPDPWCGFRANTASRFMAAAYGRFGRFLHPRDIAKQSIEYADILIEELKKQK